MSAVTHCNRGRMGWRAAEITWCRWGGGAHPGLTHVFLTPVNELTFLSKQCVVDDFGNLVEVPA